MPLFHDLELVLATLGAPFGLDGGAVVLALALVILAAATAISIWPRRR